jgi:hypothetical protein
MSMTDPIFSSLAGPNPPNPVLAVRSGSRELVLPPFKLSLAGDFLTRLFVTSGIALNIILGGSEDRDVRGEASRRSPCVLTVRGTLEQGVILVGTSVQDTSVGRLNL